MPVTHALIPLHQRAEWQAALRGIPHDFGHTWECNAALQLTWNQDVSLYCYEDGDSRVVCPIIERVFENRTDVVTPSGYSGFVSKGATEQFAHDWSDFAQDRAYVCGYLAHNPVLDNALVFAEAVRYNTVYTLDLTSDLDAIFAGFDRNRRRELRSPDATFDGLITDKQLLVEFLAREHEPFRQHIGAQASYYRSEESLRALGKLNHMLLAGAASGGKIQAVYAFAYTACVGTCMFYVHYPEARHFATQLLWYGIRELKQRSVPLLNLGGGVEDNDSIAQAKQRLGSTPRPLCASRQIYDAATYDRLCRRAHGNLANGYFPAYRASGSVLESA